MRVTNTTLYFLIPPAALAGLVVLWLFVAALLSWVGGWHSLAQLSPRTGAATGDDLGGCSISLSRGIFAINYNNSAHITLCQEGLALETSSLFRRYHEPFLIPWNSIDTCERQKLLLQEVTVVATRGLHVEILVRGKAGESVFAYWQKLHTNS